MHISIEYAHIYTNQHIDEEHKLSVETLRGVVADIEKDGNNHSLIVMVDDYSFPDPLFDYDSFTNWLKAQGFGPDFLLRESQLIAVCDEVIGLIKDEKLKAQTADYIKSKQKYPCSLFIAAWYLLRLGKLSSNVFPASLKADALINILPESFKPFEDKAIKIIESTEFSEATKNISYKFLEGRIIA